MKYKFEEEFRAAKPETIGESDRHFDLDNYKDWLESELSLTRSVSAMMLEALQDVWDHFDSMEPNLTDHEKAIKKRISEAIKATE